MSKRSYIDQDRGFAEMRTTSDTMSNGPPRKKTKFDNLTEGNGASLGYAEERPDSDQLREGDDEREDTVSAFTSAVHAAAMPRSKGVILRSGRIRLPDKLIQYLNNSVAPSLFWQPDGQGFSLDCDKIQTELLDRFFHGTKLSSFLRSLNRWGFKRLFYHSMPKSTLSFHHPLFCRDSPDLCKDMNMAPCSAGSLTATAGTEAKKNTKTASTTKVGEATILASSLDQVAATPVIPTVARSNPLAQVPRPVEALIAQSLYARDARPQAAVQALQAPPAAPPGLHALLEEMRTQVAAEAATKQLLLLHAIAAEQQHNAMQNNQTHSNSQVSLNLLEAVLSALVTGGQQLATSNSQLVALATALLTGAGSPAAPVPAPHPQEQVTSSFPQLLTPAQQLDILARLAVANSNGINPRI